MGKPSKSSSDTATVSVKVARNANCPVIENRKYVAEINETESREVLRIYARDSDSEVKPKLL